MPQLVEPRLGKAQLFIEVSIDCREMEGGRHKTPPDLAREV
jgi:hypothetical protein